MTSSKSKSFHQSSTQIPLQQPRRTVSEVRETDRALFTRTSSGNLDGVNEYIFERSLGKGSYAEVKLAFVDNNPLQKYAIKIFNKSFLKQKKSLELNRRDRRMTVTTALDSVEREIAIMKKLIHPNIVQLFEVIDDGSADYLFMVLEYVEDGECMIYDPKSSSFSSKITGGVIGEPLAAQYMSDILNGLGFLHANHICHRDIKPENILIGKDGHLKMSDFGVSHIFEENNFRNSYSLKFASRSKSRGQLHRTEGTWYFWAPEMCRGDKSYSGYATDLWAVGIVLWVFLFGKLPYADVDNPLELFEMIQYHEFVIPEKISAECEHFLFGLLEKNPEVRMVLQDALQHIWILQNYSHHQRSSYLPVILVSNDEMKNAFTNIATISVGGDELIRSNTPSPKSFTGDESEPIVEEKKEDTDPQQTISKTEQSNFNLKCYSCSYTCVIL